jgi:hypothetical protein
MTVVYKYLGRGHFVGVPARDLTAQDAARLSAPTQQGLVASGLYDFVPAPAPKAASRAKRRNFTAVRPPEGPAKPEEVIDNG